MYRISSVPRRFRDRLSKSYHRRWHLGHGKFNAIARRPEWEGTRRLLGVPMFMYRQAIEAFLQLSKSLLRADRAGAFECEMNLLFYLGFFKQRWKTHLLRTQNSAAPATQSS
jgi:hypothetical protein